MATGLQPVMNKLMVCQQHCGAMTDTNRMVKMRDMLVGIHALINDRLVDR